MTMALRRSILSVTTANERIFLYGFDLIELNGDDLRRDPLEVRKATLASIVAKASPGIRFNEHMEGDGATISPMPARWGLKVSCRSARTRPTVPAAHPIGSK
jgi:bifunctional non-homologous end joining protein LigD